MKVFLFILSACFFLAKDVSSLSSTLIGDVLIETQNNGLLYCDSMICPKGTAKCHVTKRNDPTNFQIIIRHRRCVGANGEILQEQTVNERNKYQSVVNVNVVTGGGIPNSVRPLTAQEQKELDQFLKQTEQRVQSQVGGAIDKVYTALGPLLDGSFATNLQNKITNSLRNPFYF